MVSKVEPDRYANTGFSIKDTPPELNEWLYQEMMKKTGEERFLMGASMSSMARAQVWSQIPADWPETERRREFLRRFYGKDLEELIGGEPYIPFT